MKILIAVMFIFLIGCSVSPKKVKVKNPEYSKDIVAVLLEEKSGGQCHSPDNVSKKEPNWKDQLVSANLCWKKGKWKSLRAWGQAIIEKHPDSPWGAFYLSISEKELGKKELAHWMILKAEELAPTSGIIVYHKSKLLWSMNYKSESVKEMQRAVSLLPNLIEGHLFLAQVFISYSKHKKAKEYLKNILSLNSQHKEALQLLSRFKKKKTIIVGQRTSSEEGK